MKTIQDLKVFICTHIKCIGGDNEKIRIHKDSIFMDEFGLEINFTKIKNNNVAAILLSYKSLLRNKRELIKYLPREDFLQITRFVILCAAEQKIAMSFEEEVKNG